MKCKQSLTNFLKKLQILEKLEKWSIFVSKLTFFSGKKMEMHLNFCA